MTTSTNFQNQISRQLFPISLGDSGCLYLSHAEVERLLESIETLLFFSLAESERQFEVADVSLSIKEVLALKEELNSAIWKQDPRATIP